MCAVGRKVLIQGEARKNKSHRKKYFVLNCCPSYTRPRLDYFSNIDKWNQHKNDIYNDIPDPDSFRSIDLSKLFFIDDVHRSKPKHGGLDLYMEDKYMTLIFSSDETKEQWKEIFHNVIYKNGKIKSYPKIEHTLQVALRFKPMQNIDKALLLQLKGDFRACFMKTSLAFVNNSLANPDFMIEYQFIRKLESRFDGGFRLELGRAAPIGECNLIMKLADYAESNAAHAMLINCTKSFKIPLPEPVRLRSSGYKLSDRSSSISCSRQMSLISSSCEPIRSESYIDCPGDAFSVIGSQADTVETLQGEDESNYLTMNVTKDEDLTNSTDVKNYFEHITRIYKCSACGYFTKVIRFCSRCTSTSSFNSIRVLFKSEAWPNTLATKLIPSIRDKAKSLTERPHIHLPDAQMTKSAISQSSQSSSKTSTSSKLESQNCLSICSNRHDDDIFAEIDCDNLDSNIPSFTTQGDTQFSLKCHNCLHSLVHSGGANDLSSLDQRCTKCCSEMLSMTMIANGSNDSDYNDWIPRTTSLIAPSSVRKTVSSKCNNEYVETNHTDVLAGAIKA